VTYITLAEVAESFDLYDAVLEFDVDGAWRWKRIDVDPQGEHGDSTHTEAPTLDGAHSATRNAVSFNEKRGVHDQ
jgi:hypothetical protein